MITAPIPANESERLQALLDYEVLDSESEDQFEELAFLASQICKTPVAAITLVDTDRQWFKAIHGLDYKGSSRDIAFCAHTILEPEILEVKNALQDERFHDNPFVVEGPKLRAYAGVPLTTPMGFPLGALCVLDRTARDFTAAQKESLKVIAGQVMTHLELRRMKMKFRPKFSHEGGVLAALSHELRTPLNGILGATELLLDSNLSEDQKTYVQLSQRSVSHMLETVDNLLKLGKSISFSPKNK